MILNILKLCWRKPKKITKELRLKVAERKVYQLNEEIESFNPWYHDEFYEKVYADLEYWEELFWTLKRI